MTQEFDVDAPELRLIAQLAGVAPSRLAAGLNNPERILDHLSSTECFRIADAFKGLVDFEVRMNTALDVALAHITRTRSN